MREIICVCRNARCIIGLESCASGGALVLRQNRRKMESGWHQTRRILAKFHSCQFYNARGRRQRKLIKTSHTPRREESRWLEMKTQTPAFTGHFTVLYFNCKGQQTFGENETCFKFNKRCDFVHSPQL
jgi:hypothetical protein